MSKRQENKDWLRGYAETEIKLRNAGPDKVAMLRQVVEHAHRNREYDEGAMHAIVEAEDALARVPALTLVRKR